MCFWMLVFQLIGTYRIELLLIRIRIQIMPKYFHTYCIVLVYIRCFFPAIAQWDVCSLPMSLSYLLRRHMTPMLQTIHKADESCL